MVWQYATPFSTPSSVYSSRQLLYEAGKKEPKKLTVRGPAADDSAEQGGNVKPAAMPFENVTDELWRQSIVCAVSGEDRHSSI